MGTGSNPADVSRFPRHNVKIILDFTIFFKNFYEENLLLNVLKNNKIINFLSP